MAALSAEAEEEVDVLVQRVVKDISNALKRNPNIDEVGVIPCPDARCNRSPIVLLENKLGVESWCIKFLLPSVHNKLLLHRHSNIWIHREALVDITCTLLLLNPDFSTAWNVRKELLQCGVLTPQNELYLSQLALTKFPKSPETWIHRRWVLQLILHHASADLHKSPTHPAARRPEPGEHHPGLGERLSRTLQQEMEVCSQAAARYPSNYNAWSHRVWVLQRIGQGDTKVLHDELSSMRLWVSMHVSDHSGFHYRQFLIKELMMELGCTPPTPAELLSTCHNSDGQPWTAAGVEPSPELQLFQEEMELCSDLMHAFPGHEALWSHRRHVFYLSQQWRRWQQQIHSGPSPVVVHGDPNSPRTGPRVCACVNRLVEEGEPMEVEQQLHSTKRLRAGTQLPCLDSERGFLHGVLEGCSDSDQRRFALAYGKWLDRVFVASQS